MPGMASNRTPHLSREWMLKDAAAPARGSSRQNNPYWEAVKDCVETDGLWGNPVVGYFRFGTNRGRNHRPLAEPDGAGQEVLLEHSRPGHRDIRGRARRRRLVDPIAGTTYWAYLLAQAGVDVVCYDLNRAPNCSPMVGTARTCMPRSARKTAPTR
jgi:hypothetical protein